MDEVKKIRNLLPSIEILYLGNFTVSRLLHPIDLFFSVGLQYILDKRKKGKRDRVSYAKVELPHHNSAKGDHIPHEQEYNTKHGVSAIADEVCREIRR